MTHDLLRDALREIADEAPASTLTGLADHAVRAARRRAVRRHRLAPLAAAAVAVALAFGTLVVVEAAGGRPDVRPAGPSPTATGPGSLPDRLVPPAKLPPKATSKPIPRAGLIYYATRGGRTSVTAVSADGDEVRTVLGNVASTLFTADFALSPDGTKVAYPDMLSSTTRVDGELQRTARIRVLDLSTGRSNLVSLPSMVDEPSSAAIVGSPAWSPDGRRLALNLTVVPYPYASNSSSLLTAWLVVLDLETARVSPLVEMGVGSAQTPSWSPDGSQIAVTMDGDVPTLRIVDIASRTSRAVPLSKDSRVRNFYVTGLVGNDWSPDGRTIALIRHDSTADTEALVFVDVATGNLAAGTEPVDFGHKEFTQRLVLGWRDARTVAVEDTGTSVVSVSMDGSITPLIALSASSDVRVGELRVARNVLLDGDIHSVAAPVPPPPPVPTPAWVPWAWAAGAFLTLLAGAGWRIVRQTEASD